VNSKKTLTGTLFTFSACNSISTLSRKRELEERFSRQPMVKPKLSLSEYESVWNAPVLKRFPVLQKLAALQNSSNCNPR
jgi:hypothetical protein